MGKTIKGLEADNLIESILAIEHESKTIRFERVEDNKAIGQILETIVAMANTDGGHIFLGIDNLKFGKLSGSSRLVGIEENPNNMSMLVQGLNDIKPHLIDEEAITYVVDSKSSRRVAVISIPKATRDFHILGKRVFVRQDTGNRELSPYEYADMVYAKGFKKADRELVKGVDFSLLNTK